MVLNSMIAVRKANENDHVNQFLKYSLLSAIIGSTSRVIDLIVYGCNAQPCRFVVGNTYFMEARVESGK